MPRKQTWCARGPGHPPPCATPGAMEAQRRRAADRVLTHGRSYDREVKRMWRVGYRLSRYGLTQEQFDRMLEAQGYACAMGREPFEDDQFIYIDHDHACCPVEPGAQTKCCGDCVRGLLCFRCNTALGYIEMYGELARVYLDQSPNIIVS
jgi:hypothetical protein